MIDMSSVDLPGFLDSLPVRFPELKDPIAKCGPVLIQINDVLSAYGQGYGYRLVEEFVLYHQFATSRLGRNSADVIDEQLVQKGLVKLRGTEAERKMLEDLGRICADRPRSSVVVNRLIADLNELGSFQNSR